MCLLLVHCHSFQRIWTKFGKWLSYALEMVMKHDVPERERLSS